MQAAEAVLLRGGAVWHASLVIVPARGSHLSSAPEFVRAVHARWAVVAAAHLNRFGYPRPEVIARWRSAGAEVRQVSLEGATILCSRADGSVTLPPGERLTNPRYWTAK
jgi:competence protein ComEC